MKRIIAVVAFVGLIAGAFAQVDPNRTIVVVNGDQVKGNEYYRRMETLPDVGRVLEGGQVAVYPPGFLTIIQLIDERLVLQMAASKGLTPSNAEIDKEMRESISSDPTLKERWINAGHTDDELHYQFKFQVAQFKLATEGVNVTDQEVTDWYHHNTPATARTVTLRMIAVTDAQDEKLVDQDLAAGKSFAEVASTRSKDITQANAGELGTVKTDLLPKEVVAVLDKTHVNEQTSWVDIGSNAHVKYLIEAKEAAKPIPFDENLKAQIRKKLMQDKGSVRNNLVKEMSDFRKTAKVEISNKEFADMYQKFVTAYLRN